VQIAIVLSRAHDQKHCVRFVGVLRALPERAYVTSGVARLFYRL